MCSCQLKAQLWLLSRQKFVKVGMTPLVFSSPHLFPCSSPRAYLCADCRCQTKYFWNPPQTKEKRRIKMFCKHQTTIKPWLCMLYTCPYNLPYYSYSLNTKIRSFSLLPLCLKIISLFGVFLRTCIWPPLVVNAVSHS